MTSPKLRERNAKRRAELEEYAREEAKKPQYEKVIVTEDGEVWRHLRQHEEEAPDA